MNLSGKGADVYGGRTRKRKKVSNDRVSLEASKRKFRRDNPNLRVNGWDERDYALSSQVRQLLSYGLIANGDYMISKNAVLKLLDEAAEARFKAEWAAGVKA